LSGTPQGPGALDAIARINNNITVIDDALNLTDQSIIWKVNVIPGPYYFTLNDSFETVYSGNFEVYDPMAPVTTTPLISSSTPIIITSKSSSGLITTTPLSPATTTTTSSSVGKSSSLTKAR